MDGNNLTVLVVDDDEDDLFLTCEQLSRIEAYTLNIDKEINYKKAVKTILEDRHDIYFVDYLLGPHTGIDLIRECIHAGIRKPFTLLTGKGDKQVDIKAAYAGAYDYLTKSDLNPELLERSLRYSTQRYLSFAAIAESESRYRGIFEKSNDIILMLDSYFRIVSFNPMMNILMSYLPEEILDQFISKFFANPEDASRFMSQLTDNRATNKTEITLVTKSGTRKTFFASFSVISALGEKKQYQLILNDYTALRKSASEQLLRESTERLVRSMAHEIRNPLTNINLSIYELEKGLPEDKQPLADIIKRNSTRINDMISELISLSNPIYKNDQALELENVVKSSLIFAADRIKLKKIKLHEDYRDGNSLIKGDMKKLQIAILNIIINAIEAMQEDQGILSIETNVSGNQAQIKIADNGDGIPDENLSLLFQPYFTRKKNGMGLGLAMTHSIIHAHNGSIEVESATGKGTAFTILLNTEPLTEAV